MNLHKPVLASLVFFLVACDNTPEHLNFNMPEELKDCVIFRIHYGSGSGGSMKVVRCPNSATTLSYSSVRQLKLTVVIDDINYVPAELLTNPELPTK
jgi:hypothetical protein